MLTYAQVKALAISEPLMKELAEKQNEIQRLRILSSSFSQNLSDAIESAENKKKQLSVLKKRLESTLANADFLAQFTGADYKHAINLIKMALNKTTIFGEATLPKDLAAMDFKISLPDRQNEKKPYIILARLNTHYELDISTSVSGNARRLYNFFIHFPRQAENIQAQIDKRENSLKELDNVIRKRNPYPDQIRILQAEADHLQAQMIETQNKRRNARNR